MANNGAGQMFNAPSDSLSFYTDQTALFAALAAGDVQVIFVDESYAANLPATNAMIGDPVTGYARSCICLPPRQNNGDRETE